MGHSFVSLFAAWYCDFVVSVLAGEAARVLYVAVGFLTIVIVAMLVPIRIVQAMNHFASWMETVIIMGIINLFLFIPAGLVFMIIAGIFFLVKSKR
ncbi:hypothetical protein [Geomicrobium sp. JCM 19037]|uniref:hypothetical protein n=1 Tax=Geomicrobium sp. JCM 19037 TaxID=1460634 RepID=UPI0005A82881|nr:hypothetical protein [Geomicrobium sp. JCM 19037]